MMNEKEFCNRLDRRLSGLCASGERRQRIREAVEAERKRSEAMMAEILAMKAQITNIITAVVFRMFFPPFIVIRSIRMIFRILLRLIPVISSTSLQFTLRKYMCGNFSEQYGKPKQHNMQYQYKTYLRRPLGREHRQF